jgi:hypothetical protein
LISAGEELWVRLQLPFSLCAEPRLPIPMPAVHGITNTNPQRHDTTKGEPRVCISSLRATRHSSLLLSSSPGSWGKSTESGCISTPLTATVDALGSRSQGPPTETSPSQVLMLVSGAVAKEATVVLHGVAQIFSSLAGLGLFQPALTASGLCRYSLAEAATATSIPTTTTRYTGLPNIARIRPSNTKQPLPVCQELQHSYPTQCMASERTFDSVTVLHKRPETKHKASGVPLP